MKKNIISSGILLLFILMPIMAQSQLKKEEVIDIIYLANDRWQKTHQEQKSAFWDHAAYHTGNIEAYFLTKKAQYLQFSEMWADNCEWKGAKSDDKSAWKYKKYGESDDYVLFGDWQACFQTYIDLYNINPESKRIARAKFVMGYQITTPDVDYWWWVDGLYMVMPVMSKMYKVTKNELYLEKLYQYWQYSNGIMWDKDEKLYFRDAGFLYPKHKTPNGKKDFWSRGNGWAFAALAKVLQDIPKDHQYRNTYIEYFTGMADALIACQQPEGHWSRSLIDPNYAPGYETSGSAFFTYGLFWGINNGYLNKDKYLPAALKGWEYLSTIALQSDGRVGYIQPIGASADPKQVVDKSSSWNFGMGAFLLAACEVYRYLDANPSHDPENSIAATKSITRYIKSSNSLQIQLNEKMIDQRIQVTLFGIDGFSLFKKEIRGESIVNIPLNDIRSKGVFLVNISTEEILALNENSKILIF